ncbi:MAG TPA: hypothetical protein VGM30_21035 [Puia sp.]|jgi:hypothetical protein
MVTSISIIGGLEPIIVFNIPIPLLTTNHFLYGLLPQKKEGSNILHVGIQYFLEDAITNDRYRVTEYKASYLIETDGKVESIEKLYPICLQAYGGLKMWLEMHSRAHKTPQTDNEHPPLSYLRKQLEGVVGYFDSDQNFV